jgi:hypothetical protein
VQINLLPIDFGQNGGFRQARADFLGNIKRRNWAIKLLLAAIGKDYGKHRGFKDLESVDRKNCRGGEARQIEASASRRFGLRISGLVASIWGKPLITNRTIR